MQSGRWLCIGPQVARLRPSSRADILLETRPLIFSGFFSRPPPRVLTRCPEGSQDGGRRPLPSAAPPSPASQKKSGAAEQTKRVGFVGAPEQAKTEQNRGLGACFAEPCCRWAAAVASPVRRRRGHGLRLQRVGRQHDAGLRDLCRPILHAESSDRRAARAAWTAFSSECEGMLVGETPKVSKRKFSF